MKFAPLLQQLLLRFHMVRVRDTAVIDGTYLDTARRLKPTDTLGAFFGVDYIDCLALSNRLVLALCLASAAAHALLCDLIGHLLTS